MNKIGYFKKIALKQKYIKRFIQKKRPRLAYQVSMKWPVETIDLEKTHEGWFYDDDTIEDIIESKKYRYESKLLKDTAHVKFLQQFKEAEHATDEELRKSLYYNEAILELRLVGHFRGNATEKDILEQMKYFLNLYKSIRNNTFQKNYKKFADISKNRLPEKYPTVARILNSDHYMICDGHHRLACQYIAGAQYVEARIVGIKKNRLQAWDHVNQCY